MKFFSCFCLSIILFACNSSQVCNQSVQATLHNYTGLDGCGWVLELNDGSKLEPQNLDDFEIELEEGKKLHIKYEKVDAGSICMVGDVVKIKCLSED